MKGPDIASARRRAEQALWAVRLLCAIGFWPGLCLLVMGATGSMGGQATMRLWAEYQQVRADARERPDDPEARRALDIAERFRRGESRAQSFADGASVIGGGLLTFGGLLGVFLGNRLGGILRDLNSDSDETLSP